MEEAGAPSTSRSTSTAVRSVQSTKRLLSVTLILNLNMCVKTIEIIIFQTTLLPRHDHTILLRELK